MTVLVAAARLPSLFSTSASNEPERPDDTLRVSPTELPAGLLYEVIFSVSLARCSRTRCVWQIFDVFTGNAARRRETEGKKTKERHDDHSEKRWMISILDAALLLHLVQL